MFEFVGCFWFRLWIWYEFMFFFILSCWMLLATTSRNTRLTHMKLYLLHFFLVRFIIMVSRTFDLGLSYSTVPEDTTGAAGFLASSEDQQSGERTIQLDGKKVWFLYCIFFELFGVVLSQCYSSVFQSCWCLFINEECGLSVKRQYRILFHGASPKDQVSFSHYPQQAGRSVVEQTLGRQPLQ